MISAVSTPENVGRDPSGAVFLPGRASCFYEAAAMAGMDRDELLKLLLPLWGVAFVAGFVMACR